MERPFTGMIEVRITRTYTLPQSRNGYASTAAVAQDLDKKLGRRRAQVRPLTWAGAGPR
ncbi:hypothetical protein [Streptomyces chartreusis]|uniref:hypothetical protein n=1 Tax=Streptomyces chartreusis TaxID=1969 RepID=UPI0033D7F01C